MEVAIGGLILVHCDVDMIGIISRCLRHLDKLHKCGGTSRKLNEDGFEVALYSSEVFRADVNGPSLRKREPQPEADARRCHERCTMQTTTRTCAFRQLSQAPCEGASAACISSDGSVVRE
jgi:hypothetical protein